jgi:hypothetical protein
MAQHWELSVKIRIYLAFNPINELRCFGVDAWFSFASTAIAPTDDTNQRPLSFNISNQWSTGVALKRNNSIAT